MQLQQTVVAGPDLGRTFLLAGGQSIAIGRGRDTHTMLKDPRVSRRHCVLDVIGGRVSLTDGGGSGGTLVNNVKIGRVELQPGDLVQIGETILRFDIQSASEATLPPVAPAASETEHAGDLSDQIGKTLHHYEIVRELAKGASGAVFLARHTRTGRDTAVKVLWPMLTRDEEQTQRFIRAMKTMLPVRHENIIRLYNAGISRRLAWVSMEYVDGESITQVIQRIGVVGMLDWHNAWRVAVHIGRALACAAEQRFIHRNITPANILLTRDKVAKLGDLMFARALEGMGAEMITRPGQLVGQLAYMSPERTRGMADVDCRADIYSLGATIYALLTGRPPFSDPSLPGLIDKIRNHEPVKPAKYQLAIPDMFLGVALRALAKRPEDRYQTATEMLKDLERFGKYNNATL